MLFSARFCCVEVVHPLIDIVLYLLETQSPFSKKISWSPSFMVTAGAVAPGARLALRLSEVKLNESSRAEMFGTESDFLRGAFLGVLNEERRENRGIFLFYFFLLCS